MIATEKIVIYIVKSWVHSLCSPFLEELAQFFGIRL
jgi:hypothetical protein